MMQRSRIVLLVMIVAAATTSRAEVTQWYSEAQGGERIVVDGKNYHHFRIVGNRTNLIKLFWRDKC